MRNLRIWKKPGNLHAKGPANKDKAIPKIKNMLCHKLIAELTTGHGVHVQELDQANEDLYGGTMPLHEQKKQKIKFAGRTDGQKEL